MSKMIRRALGAAAAALSLSIATVSIAQPIEIKIADSFPKGHVIYDTVVSTLIAAGTVSEEGGGGIGRVLVKLPLPDGSAIEAKTDDSGKWNVNGVGKGEFTMVIYKEGFATKTVRLVVEKETMRPEPFKIVLKMS